LNGDAGLRHLLMHHRSSACVAGPWTSGRRWRRCMRSQSEV